MRKIVFIYPKVGYMDAHRNKPAPPLGILAAVSFLKNNYGIIILDQRLFTSDKKFYSQLQKLLEEQPLYVGLSVYTGGMITFALEISKYIKENSTIPVVWGGVHPTLLPEQTLENRYIDYVIQGEGELTLPEFSEMLERHSRNTSPVKGVWIKKENAISYGGDRDLMDMQLLPAIPYELIDFSNYVQYFNGKKYVYYQASRGCPYHCGYCYNNVFNEGKFRAQSVDKIISELKGLREKYFFEGVFFVDDNIFALGKKYIMTLGKELSQLGLSWYVQGSDVVSLKEYTEDDFKFLETSGLTRLAIGIESASRKIRLLINKQGSLEDIEQVITRLSKTKILIWCTYLINIPEETIDDLYESIRLIFKLNNINKNILTAPLFIYVLNPGTPLYEKYKNISAGPTTLADWGKIGVEKKHTNIFVDYLQDPSFFQSLFLTSMLIDHKISVYFPNKFFAFLENCYSPIARWRLRNLFFKYNIELFIFKKLFPAIFL